MITKRQYHSLPITNLATARTPVTVPGRVTACFVMGIGLLTLAVVTAQVASSFVAQGPAKGPARPAGGAARPR